MVQDQERVPLDLVASIYEAALEPSQWDGVLEAVQSVLRADSGLLYLEDLQAMEASFQVLQGVDPKRLQDYFRHYIRLNPAFRYRQHKPLGTVTVSHKVLADREFARTEFYQDYLRTLGRFYTMGGHIAQEPGRIAVFSLQRSKREGPFEDADQARLRALFPHLRRAFQIGRQLADAEAERHAMLALLERIPTGVVLLDERRCVVFLNRRADSILAAGDGLVMTSQGLQAIDPKLQPVLERLIHSAVETGASRGTSAGGALSLPSVAGRESCQVLVTPLRMERVRVDLGRERICAALFLQLRDTQPALSEDVLRDLFGLTPAESRVAVALVHGRKPDEIAAESETSRFTVRAQLSAIYEKLGVHRQAEVVQRVLSSPAVLADRNGHSTDEN
ncbi:MAG TPA: LuxR C-terminal-related transcriptional regulator [bacterium]|nr:LuxR C-terminal-related transcriptional regulator [bacterium]